MLTSRLCDRPPPRPQPCRSVFPTSAGSANDSSTTTSRSFFFFQAEDGIRDYKVTGVQTCALPICRDKIPEVRAGGDGNVEDQLAGILGVPVDRAAVALVTEPEVDAGVVRAGRFPVDGLVDGARADRGDEHVTKLNLRLRVAVCVGRVLQVVADRLVAGPCPGSAQLQVRQRAEPLHEGLLRNPPRQRHRREGAPQATRAEA